MRQAATAHHTDRPIETAVYAHQTNNSETELFGDPFKLVYAVCVAAAVFIDIRQAFFFAAFFAINSIIL